MEKHFTPEFLKRMDAWINRTRDELAKTNKDWAKSFENDAKQDKERMKQRMDFVKKELPKLK